jgi:hypothetical protein
MEKVRESCFFFAELIKPLKVEILSFYTYQSSHYCPFNMQNSCCSVFYLGGGGVSAVVVAPPSPPPPTPFLNPFFQSVELKREKCSHFCGERSLLGFIHKTVIALAFFSLYCTSGSQRFLFTSMVDSYRRGEYMEPWNASF